ncbi:binding-protein-dependent transport systems inner membrane component (plasmid) [Pseudarthrobacter chlorophenolicus A6]|uniref:Binding-protein-dependent transport systems inner membrane component n=1 Tax=Pseudarthrobacter chlorophenolicus (strain ATCC 700700 / DSM 12829 / CIP 107037 / JCM 12360 / KCTC 9906 / NCIMB 13794 / A6) TaxID=452863 RepID=B8HJH6_PSECP|nr:carbohydrate ABC transporter permease [Pseudarthrobacter chlorophenolicus]ACL42574.1 binding-protein-dependent transport systems inner membrane component [Pseudarthrobacter chlorophenolicus A6]SDQ09165.1 carbohydrate ABC transporter membrane protein 2, CUT1 family [Pseudarthrobacter chlorophenolicus]
MSTIATRRTPPTLKIIGSWTSHILLILTALITLVPFIWMISTALKPAGEVFSAPPKLIGSSIQWGNFADAWNYLPFGRFMLNGVLVSALGTLIVVSTSAMAAYAFSRLRWRGRNGVFLIYLGTLMIPQEVLIVPMFILMRNFGWVNSYQALIIPWAFTAFGTFLLRQFFLTLPDELEDAARIDGANRFVSFTKILLPLVRPALGTLAVFTFIGYWNSFLWPLLIVSDVNMATVPLGLNMFLGQTGNQWNLLMAASTISILPSVLMVLGLQRYLVKGIALSGLGGR